MLRADGPVSFAGFVIDASDARLLGAGGPVHLGRKAFQVLEALVARPGRLLTKEELFETVWDGSAVSESVLTSAIKDLRRALGDESKSPRFIESVYGRGYRFIAPVTPTPQHVLADATAAATEPRETADAARPQIPPAAPTDYVPTAYKLSDRSLSRRAMLGWGAAGAIAAAGAGFGIVRALRPTMPPEIDGLITQSWHLMDQDTLEGHNQAIGLLRRVVELAPDYADGWGLLGVAYAVPSHQGERTDGLMLRARARAAATRALALDAGNGIGELALALELPTIGHWRARDRHFDRALADRPDDDDVLTFVGAAQHANGRPSAAIDLYDRIRQRPLRPLPYSNFIRALWSAGRIEETDRALDDATALYPTQANIWYDRFCVYVSSDRAEAALALVTDPASRPPQFDGSAAAHMADVAKAARDPGSPNAERALAMMVEKARSSAFVAQITLRFAGIIGALDTAFALADAYYFSRGFAIPDANRPGSATSLDQRWTRFLFEPQAAAMRADRRFEPLVAEIGLDAYWRASGKPPDYRAA